MLDNINFNGPEWSAIKKLLLQKKATKIDLLIQAETHDQSNQVRGALRFINELLALEEAARRGR